MTNAKCDMPAGDTEPASPEPASDPNSVPSEGAHGEPCGDFAMDGGADLGGRTTLSRPPVPEGRRSLFRR